MALSSRTRLSGLNPTVRQAAEWCLAVADYYRIPVTVTSGYRSLQEQGRLRTNYERCVASGRFGQGPDCRYPANKPGESAHNYGLAFDAVVPPEYQEAWDYIRRYAGLRVLPNDRPHAEYPEWHRYV